MMNQNFFITGTDTDVGKTISSSIIVEALKADYWKPIQCGTLDNSDTHRVKELTSNQVTTFHPERFQLNAPKSPHWAAKLENKKISLEDFELPISKRPLVIEGAGGVLVPINDQDYIIDLAKRLNLQTILVTKSYLGSYNHTLCAIEALQRRGLPIWGIIFNGKSEDGFEDFVMNKSRALNKFHLKKENKFSPQIIKDYSNEFKSRFLNDSN
jgi:dethiobiotin synthetase